MNAMSKLALQAQQIAHTNREGRPVVRLGLIVTLFYRNGHTLESKQRIEECFVRFFEEFRPHLRGQFFKRARSFSPAGFTRCRKQVLASGPEETFQWSIDSAATVNEAADYRISVMNTPQCQNDSDCSCLKLVLPWAYLAEPDGLRRYEDWLRYLCNQSRAEHGYGGLACTLPMQMDAWTPYEYHYAQLFRGLMVDTQPQFSTLRLFDHIKGVSWQTVLGHSFIKRLGGSDLLRSQLSDREDVTFRTYDGGLILRVGTYPDLAPKKDGPPPESYSRVNRTIRPVRIVETGSLHCYSPDGAVFSKESSARWYARFDQRAPGRLKAGQPCSHSGFWFSSARVNSRQLFEKGELMPEFSHLIPSATHWFWAGEVD